MNETANRHLLSGTYHDGGSFAVCASNKRLHIGRRLRSGTWSGGSGKENHNYSWRAGTLIPILISTAAGGIRVF